jgi:MoaA/NifB/PqqE/SkfB family radical SAM enzyme
MTFDYYGKKVDAVIGWAPSYLCENNCWYCIQTSIRANNPLSNRNDLKENTEYLVSYFNSKGKFAFLITGGEPFILKGFVEFLRELTKKHYISIQTSLSCSIDKFVKYIKPSRTIFIRCGLHPSMLTPERFGVFIHRVRLLKSRGFKPIVCIPVEENNIGRLSELHKIFSEMDVAFEPTVCVYPDGRYPSYNPAMKQEVINQMCTEVSIKQIDFSELRYPGVMCDTGWKDIIIDYNGDVRRCWNDNYIMGNIYNSDFNFMPGPLPCGVSICGCRCYMYDEVCFKNGGKWINEMKSLIKGYVKPGGR